MDDNSLGFIMTLATIAWIIDNFFIKDRKKPRKKNYNNPQIQIYKSPVKEIVQPVGKNYGSYSYSYVKTPLLTKREWAEYQILKMAADAKGLLICPKVRLLDLVVPKYNARNSRGLMTKVMSKHVDFVICNQQMEVVCIIELDDPTHLRQDRVERDQFVDSVLMGAGYKVIHTWQINMGILDFYHSGVQPRPAESAPERPLN